MSEPRITIRQIVAIVSQEFGVPMVALRGQGRKADVAHARQIAFYLVHHHLDRTLPQIGQWFGDRDHTTILHGIRVVTERAEKDRGLAERLRGLTDRIGATEARLHIAPPAEPEEEAKQPPAPPVQVVLALADVRKDPSVRRVIDAVRGYVESRKALSDAQYSRGEAGARRRVEAEYALLDRAYSDFAADRDRS